MFSVEGCGQCADGAVAVQYLDVNILDDRAVVTGEIGKESEVFGFSLKRFIQIWPILVREEVI